MCSSTRLHSFRRRPSAVSSNWKSIAHTWRPLSPQPLGHLRRDPLALVGSPLTEESSGNAVWTKRATVTRARSSQSRTMSRQLDRKMRWINLTAGDLPQR